MRSRSNISKLDSLTLVGLLRSEQCTMFCRTWDNQSGQVSKCQGWSRMVKDGQGVNDGQGLSRMVRCQGVNQDGQLCLLRIIWKNKIGVSIGKLIHVLFNDVCRHQLSPYLSYFLLSPLHFGPNGSDVMSADHGFNQIIPSLFVYSCSIQLDRFKDRITWIRSL